MARDAGAALVRIRSGLTQLGYPGVPRSCVGLGEDCGRKPAGGSDRRGSGREPWLIRADLNSPGMAWVGPGVAWWRGKLGWASLVGPGVDRRRPWLNRALAVEAWEWLRMGWSSMDLLLAVEVLGWTGVCLGSLDAASIE